MKRSVKEKDPRTDDRPGPPDELRLSDERAREAEGETFERYAIFGSFNMRKRSRLKRGYLTCLFSTGKLDFRDAEVEGELELDVRVFFGSLRIEVPSHWEVVLEVPPIFGTTEVKGREERQARQTGTQAPMLRIRGLCILSSIIVKRS